MVVYRYIYQIGGEVDLSTKMWQTVWKEVLFFVMLGPIYITLKVTKLRNVSLVVVAIV